MSTLTVSVASPDRRSLCKITLGANATVAQLVREACVRLKIAPSATSPECLQYGLCHGRSILQDSIPLRLAGLVQGARLELTQRGTARPVAARPVRVALQTPAGGGRITLECSTQDSLLDVLMRAAATATGEAFSVYKLAPQGGQEESLLLEPHLLLEGQEYFGLSKLAETRLADAGVQQSSCLIRMMPHRAGSCDLASARQILDRAQSLRAAPAAERGRSQEGRREQTQPIVNLDTAAASPPPPASPRSRPITLYRPPRSEGELATAPDLPDGSYELGEAELRLHLATSHAKVRALLNAPLVSRSKEEERLSAEFLRQHPEARIRFRLADQYLLETTFGSTETAAQLYGFLADALATPADALSLSTGPPPKILRGDDPTPLWRLNLVPAAIVNVHSRTGRIGATHLVDQGLLASAQSLPHSPHSPPPAQNLADHRERQEVDQPGSEATLIPAPPPTNRSTSSGAQSAGGKPSWLRLGH